MRNYNSVYTRRVIRLCAQKQTVQFASIKSSLFVINITCSFIAGHLLSNMFFLKPTRL